jgi:hypothetical protein
MRAIFVFLPALLVTGVAAAQRDGRADPRDPATKVPPTEYRSAFDGYRPYAEQEPRDWRGANDEVREASGHAGHKPGQGAGQQTSKPQPGTPGSKAHGGHK